MSKENVEVVRRVWEILASRSVSEPFPDAVLAYFSDDCVLEDFPQLPDRAIYRGRDGVREIDRHWREIWGEFDQDPREFIDAGGDLIIAVIALRGRGAGSGAPLDSQAVWVLEVRDGLFTRCRAFTTKDDALEAAGLSE